VTSNKFSKTEITSALAGSRYKYQQVNWTYVLEFNDVKNVLAKPRALGERLVRVCSETT